MTKRTWAAVIAGLVVLGGAGCTGEGDVSQDDIVNDLVEDAGVPQDRAECVAEAIFDRFSQGDINDIDKQDSLDELSASIREDVEEIYADCDVAIR